MFYTYWTSVMLISEYITPVMFTDSTGYFAMAPIGFELQIGGIFGGYFSVYLVIDDNGNVGLLMSTGVGFMSPSIGVSYSPFISWRDTIFDLEGLSGVIGGSSGLGKFFGLDILLDNEGPLGIQFNYGVGVSFPTSGEGHVFYGYSKVFNIASKSEDFKDENSILFLIRDIKHYINEVFK